MENYNERFFQNTNCKYFPCHRIKNSNDFNCLFCYCPLYALGRDCGGAFYYTEKGVKDCTKCIFPHKRENYDPMLKKIKILIEAVREK